MANKMDSNNNKKSGTTVGHLEYAHAQYKVLMDKFTISPQPLSKETLQDYHDQSLQNALTIASIAEAQLTESMKQSIKTLLQEEFLKYDRINTRKSKSTAPAIGIDLGTTFCSVAVRHNNVVKVLKNDLGINKTPSYVAFLPDDDEPFIGELAQQQGNNNLKTTIYDTKRMIGRLFEDEQIQKQKSLWPFDIEECKSSGGILIKTGRRGFHSPEEVSTYLVEYLKKTAETVLGMEVHNAVVAVPASFNLKQRQLTKKACELAGLHVLQLVNEPTAGAIAYNIQKDMSSEESRNCLIFDLGGGTFDVTVLRMRNNQIFIKAAGGDPHLGGEDFDNNLVDYCLKKFGETYKIPWLTTGNYRDSVEDVKILKFLRRLKKECEKQKCFLTGTARVCVQMDAAYEGQDLFVSITRDIFESLNLHLFERCMKVVEDVIAKSKISKSEIDDIVLVGGSSRIPKVQQMLSEFFGGKQLNREINEDEAVAIGAATLAYLAENPEVENILVQEPILVKSDTQNNTDLQFATTINTQAEKDISTPVLRGPPTPPKMPSMKKKSDVLSTESLPTGVEISEQHKSSLAPKNKSDNDNAQKTKSSDKTVKPNTLPKVPNSTKAELNVISELEKILQLRKEENTNDVDQKPTVSVPVNKPEKETQSSSLTIKPFYKKTEIPVVLKPEQNDLVLNDIDKDEDEDQISTTSYSSNSPYDDGFTKPNLFSAKPEISAVSTQDQNDLLPYNENDKVEEQTFTAVSSSNSPDTEKILDSRYNKPLPEIPVGRKPLKDGLIPEEANGKHESKIPSELDEHASSDNETKLDPLHIKPWSTMVETPVFPEPEENPVLPNEDQKTAEQMTTALNLLSGPDLSTVEISGYLKRKVLQLNKISITGGNKWSDFFVALSKKQLYLWEAENGSHNTTDQCSTIDINNAKYRLTDHLGVTRLITLSTSDSQYQFLAEDEFTARSWIKHIKVHSGELERVGSFQFDSKNVAKFRLRR